MGPTSWHCTAKKGGKEQFSNQTQQPYKDSQLKVMLYKLLKPKGRKVKLLHLLYGELAPQDTLRPPDSKHQNSTILTHNQSVMYAHRLSVCWLSYELQILNSSHNRESKQHVPVEPEGAIPVLWTSDSGLNANPNPKFNSTQQNATHYILLLTVIWKSLYYNNVLHTVFLGG